MAEPVTVFVSYSHRDEALRQEFDKHLATLKRNGVVREWSDRMLGAGDAWQDAIDEHLERAGVILLLVSSDFLASEYCYGVELKRALERELAQSARVIPIILRACDWQTAPFGRLQALPREGRPITSWENRDEAWAEVVQGLRGVMAGPSDVAEEPVQEAPMALMERHSSIEPVHMRKSVAAPRADESKRWPVIAGAAVASTVTLGAAVAFFVVKRPAMATVFAAGPGGAAVSNFKVSVDGIRSKDCDAAVCRVELQKGKHRLVATVDGFAPQEKIVEVGAGDDVTVRFELASDGARLKVTSQQSGIQLSVDGKPIGVLPQEVANLSAGTHKLVFNGGDRYAVEERTIVVGAKESKELAPVSLKVVRGLATFDVRTPGARVALVSPRERRELRTFVSPVDIDTSRKWMIEATKPGYDDYKVPLVFDDEAEKTFVIDLRVTKGAKVVVEPPPVQQNADTCTVSFRSALKSTVYLDGKEIGDAPAIGVKVVADTPHTATFVHPEGGKEGRSFSCKKGEIKSISP